MGTISLLRVDFRMIHGQVIVKWLRNTGANSIIGVNDAIASDPFLQDIYKMSAPNGVSVEVLTKEDAISRFKDPSKWEGKALVLFKNVEDVYYCYKNGFPMEKIQIGGLGAGPDRINVFGPITLNKTDAKLLKEMDDAGTTVIFHQVPDEASATLSNILKKNDFGLN